MASISTSANGLRRIDFVGANGIRRTVRLGRITKKDAETIKVRIEALISAQLAKVSLDNETATWLADLPDKLYDKLAANCLAPRRVKSEQRQLQDYVDAYIAGRTDVKPATKEIWRQGRKGLLDFFGNKRPIDEITPGDADRYKLHLIGSIARGTFASPKGRIARRLSTMTVRKRLQFATTIFRAALRDKLIKESPFEGISIQTSMPKKERFITITEFEQLIEACPDTTWRTILALCRLAGMRCPSEVLSLKWSMIDWHAGTFEVHSPKTEHHPGRDMRTVPLFPELRPYLESARSEASPDAVYVIDESFRKRAIDGQGWRSCNLRTRFEKIIRRSGVAPWPRIFHCLRSTRQTELTERFPSHVVCAWLGNSEEIAKVHYLQVTPEHLRKALDASCEKAPQKAPQSAAVSHGLVETGKPGYSDSLVVKELRTCCCCSSPCKSSDELRIPESLPIRFFALGEKAEHWSKRAGDQ